MLSNEVGAVQPVAVTTRSALRVRPSLNATLDTRLLPSTDTMLSPLRASSTATTSTPTRSRSVTAASPSGLAVMTTALFPGFTAQRLMSRRVAPESMTPGVSLPANTYGRSTRPGATTITPARALMRRSGAMSWLRCMMEIQLWS